MSVTIMGCDIKTSKRKSVLISLWYPLGTCSVQKKLLFHHRNLGKWVPNFFYSVGLRMAIQGGWVTRTQSFFLPPLSLVSHHQINFKQVAWWNYCSYTSVLGLNIEKYQKLPLHSSNKNPWEKNCILPQNKSKLIKVTPYRELGLCLFSTNYYRFCNIFLEVFHKHSYFLSFQARAELPGWRDSLDLTLGHKRQRHSALAK